MKRKEIERIPYLGLPHVSRKKGVEYVAMTAAREIGKEPHLFVEVYRNRRECREVPVARIAMTGKDFGTYFPGTGTWSRGKVKHGTWTDRSLIWRKDERGTHHTWAELAESDILHSREDLDRIQAFTGEETWDPRRWWNCIEQKQEEITRKERAARTARKRERRQQALEDRERNTAGLPEGRILQYADDTIFARKHFLYYRKHGSRVEVACSACGGISDERWKRRTSYEGMFEKIIEEPRAGVNGTCPLCGKTGEYMPQGKAPDRHTMEAYIFLGQKYREKGLVLRYVNVSKEWILDQACGEKGLEMTGALEELTGIEVARVYFEPGKKIVRDFHKHDPYAGKDFWDDCNISYGGSITIKPARIMPETYEAMGGTFLRYSAMREYQRAAGEINPVDYLENYVHTPQIEILAKMGLTGVVTELVRYHYGIVADMDAKRVDQFLGIKKEKVKFLRENHGDVGLLEVLQMEKREGQNWTEEQVRNLSEVGCRRENQWKFAEAMKHMTVQKLLNRISRYAGCGYGTGCSRAKKRLWETAGEYLDYLDMRGKLGYSLENTVYQQPRDLEAAHGKMVYECSRKKMDDRLREVAARFPLIRKHYRRLRNRYFYEDDTYRIRPARSAEEIVAEGRILHHCVGGDGYLGSHNEGKSYILLLRYRDTPDDPYITVEVGKDGRIIQWYGAHDKKPDREKMQGWLDAYETRLKCGGMAAGAEVRIAVTA